MNASDKLIIAEMLVKLHSVYGGTPSAAEAEAWSEALVGHDLSRVAYCATRWIRGGESIVTRVSPTGQEEYTPTGRHFPKPAELLMLYWSARGEHEARADAKALASVPRKALPASAGNATDTPYQQCLAAVRELCKDIGQIRARTDAPGDPQFDYWFRMGQAQIDNAAVAHEIRSRIAATRQQGGPDGKGERGRVRKNVGKHRVG